MKKLFFILLIFFGFIASACSQTIVRNALLIRIGNDTVYIRANGTILEIYSSDTTQFNNVMKFLSNINADQYINFKGADGNYGTPRPRIFASGDTLGFGDENGTYFLRDLLAGISLVDTLKFTEGNVSITSNTGSPDDALRFHIDGDIVSIQNVNGSDNVMSGIAGLDLTPISNPPLSVFGMIYCDSDDSIFYQHNGTEFIPFGSGGGGGTGTVSTDLNQVSIGTGTNTVGGSNKFTITFPDDSATLRLFFPDAYGKKSAIRIDSTATAGIRIFNSYGGVHVENVAADGFHVENAAHYGFYSSGADLYDIYVDSKFAVGDSVYLHYLNLAHGDTVALLAIGENEKIDSASLVPPASRAWDVELKPFEEYFNESERLKALPLVMPNGKARRQMNAMYMAYQTEYELETHARYMDQLFKRIRALEKENAKLSRKPKRKEFKELLMRVESLEQRVANLEQKICK